MNLRKAIYLVVFVTVAGSFALRFTGVIGEDSYWRGSGLIVLLGAALLLIILSVYEKRKN